MPPAPERPSRALQENLISLLAHSDQYGRLVAYGARVELFEGDYYTIAERCIEYWRVEKQAPKTHVGDLFTDILEDRGNRRRGEFRRLLVAMQQLSQAGINAQWVMKQLARFTRMQALKAAILEAAEAINDPSGANVERVEELLDAVLRARTTSMSPGIRADDFMVVVRKAQLPDEFDTGVSMLDVRHIVPQRKHVSCLLAPSGLGKSWWLLNLGKRALLRRKRVLHIGLELDDTELLQRYYQSIFAIPTRSTKRTRRIAVPRFELDERERMVSISRDTIVPEFTMQSPILASELSSRIEHWQNMLRELIIKDYPQGRLTMGELTAYLDYLETAESFSPDLLLIDYPQLFSIPAKDFRLHLGTLYRDLKGLAQDRNIACGVVHQINRSGAKAKRSRSTDVGEAWSIVQTCDEIITYSQTEQEKAFGLARLFVDKGRSDADKFGCVISQSYDIGQFVLDCAALPRRYWDMLNAEEAADEEMEARDTADEESSSGSDLVS